MFQNAFQTTPAQKDALTLATDVIGRASERWNKATQAILGNPTAGLEALATAGREQFADNLETAKKSVDLFGRAAGEALEKARQVGAQAEASGSKARR